MRAAAAVASHACVFIRRPLPRVRPTYGPNADGQAALVDGGGGGGVYDYRRCGTRPPRIRTLYTYTTYNIYAAAAESWTPVCFQRWTGTRSRNRSRTCATSPQWTGGRCPGAYKREYTERLLTFSNIFFVIFHPLGNPPPDEPGAYRRRVSTHKRTRRSRKITVKNVSRRRPSRSKEPNLPQDLQQKENPIISVSKNHVVPSTFTPYASQRVRSTCDATASIADATLYPSYPSLCVRCKIVTPLLRRTVYVRWFREIYRGCVARVSRDSANNKMRKKKSHVFSSLGNRGGRMSVFIIFIDCYKPLTIAQRRRHFNVGYKVVFYLYIRTIVLMSTLSSIRRH